MTPILQAPTAPAPPHISYQHNGGIITRYALVSEPTPLARLLFADCPWKNNDRRAVRRDNPEKKPKFGIGACRYSWGTMPTSEICSMGPSVLARATLDAYLFLWATCPMLPDAFEVMAAWGFRYVTVALVWIKTYGETGGLELELDELAPLVRALEPLMPKLGALGRLDPEDLLLLILEALVMAAQLEGPDKEDFFGVGRYIPSNIELCLLGVRGKPWSPTQGSKPRQVIRCPHPRDGKTKIHSRKPEEAQDRIEKWLKPHLDGGSMLELFATRARPGWTCLGSELSHRDIRLDLQLLDFERAEHRLGLL